MLLCFPGNKYTDVLTKLGCQGASACYLKTKPAFFTMNRHQNIMGMNFSIMA